MATKGQINVDFALRYVGAVGANRYVANVSRYSTIAYRDIVQYAARAAHVPESAVDVAMEALFDSLSYFVLNGHNVKIDGIGTFAFGVNAKAEINEEDAGADSVHRLKILYLPEMDLRREMNNVSITTSTSNPGNLAEDSEAAKWKIDRVSFGTTRQNAKGIPSFGIVQLVKGTNFIILEGQGMDHKDMTGPLEYHWVDPEDPEEPSYGVVQISSAVQRVYSSYRKAIYKIDVPNDGYADHFVLHTNDEAGFQQQGFYYSLPEVSPYTAIIPDMAAISKAQLNGVLLTDNMTALPTDQGKFFLLVEGPNVRSVQITATGASIVSDISTVNRVQYLVTPNEGASSFTLSYRNEGAAEQTYHISLGSSSQQVVVNALSANGVSISNGGSSTVVEGETYNFTLSGLNLNLLSADNLSVPVGSSVRNFAKSANSISFQLLNAASGDIKITYEGAEIFKVTVEAYEPAEGDVTITSIGGVGNNGTYDGESENHRMTLNIVGTDLDTLTPASFTFSQSGYSFTLNEGTATARQVTIASSGSFGAGVLRVMNGETTIFTLNITNGGSVEF